MQSNLQALDTYSVMTGDRRYEKLLGESGTSQEAQKYGSTTQFNSNEC